MTLLKEKGKYYMKTYENFSSVLLNMKDIYRYDEPYDNVVLTGLVGLYKICFEQSWKMMRMITNEEVWIKALQSRNNVAHAYNHQIALDIVSHAKNEYYDMFCELKKEIDEKWM